MEDGKSLFVIEIKANRKHSDRDREREKVCVGEREKGSNTPLPALIMNHFHDCPLHWLSVSRFMGSSSTGSSIGGGGGGFIGPKNSATHYPGLHIAVVSLFLVAV